MEKSKNVILVPTDFSEVCYDAIVYGANMAKNMGFELCLLHVINKESKENIKNEANSDTIIDEKLTALAKEMKDNINVNTTYIAKEGNIFTTIPEVAEEKNASLVVLGTHGKVGIKQQMFGSYANKVVTAVSAPVIVIQKGVKFNNGLTDIVFPVKAKAETHQKVGWAATLAKKFNATIHIFYEIPKLNEDFIKIKIISERIMDEFDKKGVKYIQKEAEARRYEENLCAYAKENNSNMIVILSDERIQFLNTPEEEKIIFNKEQIPIMCIDEVDYNGPSRMW